MVDANLSACTAPAEGVSGEVFNVGCGDRISVTDLWQAIQEALGVDVELAHTSIRFGIGRFTTEEEIDYAIQSVREHVGRLREMSPLWEMVQEGIDIKSIEWADH